ncbi:hypothetical protein L596_008753 [Steinernema carpocapsae]|uniref:Carboxylic ester hydrolase n=1 Tax=Steinernema carpocapsae TaxID=34508 RepID=A0A4U5PDF6_STECR|nr:hypothetical protein L596_008753 [Steinernema carpocapsae]
MLALLLSASLAGVFSSPPVIQTYLGLIEGFEYSLNNGKSADVFLGVPYASPPVGQLRYELPYPPFPWFGVKKAKTFGAPCFQHTDQFVLTGPGNFSEDCLTLNIMAPHEKSPDPRGYPVVVFIHGGGFEVGGSNFYPYQNISQNFVSQGIVFVTINYRLSAFGFFTTGDGVVPGNLGYWDQTMALRFVKQHIRAFRGNPQSITLMGESAGSASVSALSLSPHSSYLFHRAICMSGSQYTIFASHDRVKTASFELAKALNCTGWSYRIARCMKSKTSQQIRDAIKIIGYSVDQLNPVQFNPYFDGVFFPEEPHRLIKHARKIPTIIGTNDFEGGFFTLIDLVYLYQSAVPQAKWANYSASDLESYLTTKMVPADYGSDNINKMAKKLIDYYVKRGGPNLTNTDYLERFGDVFTDVMFNIPVHQEAKDKVTAGIPVYIFRQEYHNPILTEKFPVKKAFHGNEIPYLLGAFFQGTPFQFDENDLAFQKDLLAGLVPFIKTGKPGKVSGQVWEPVTKRDLGRYMSFAIPSKMKSNFVQEAVDFWTKEMCSGVDAHMIREELLPGFRCP